MIKNIVFDLGGVLVSWEPKESIRKIMGSVNDEDVDRIFKEIFSDKTVLSQRNGYCGRDEVYRSYLDNYPENGEKYCEIFALTDKSSAQFPLTAPLLKELKAAGFSLYFISDNNETTAELLKTKADLFDYMDGGIMSYEVHLSKPSREIFECFLEKYGLVAEECVFTDDTLANVETAKALGFNTVHLKDHNALRDELCRFEDVASRLNTDK